MNLINVDFSFALFVNFTIAVSLGALIGAEREVTDIGKQQRKRGIEFSGLRTHALISLLGFITAYIGNKWGIAVAGVLAATLGLFLLLEYWLQNRSQKSVGITSELAALITFAVGATAFTAPRIAVVAGVMVVAILAMKKWIHHFLEKVKEGEFLATLKFIVIAFVILPLLPTEPVDPWGLVNLHNAWLMVVFISGISFVGYILTKTIGAQKGLGITGMVGGLASSTAVTTSMAEQSSHNKKMSSPFTFAVIISGAIMFIRVAFEVLVLNRGLLPKLAATLGVMLIVSAGVLGYLWWSSSKAEHQKKSEELILSSPFRLSPALKFGIFYIFVGVLAHMANRFFGEGGVYVASTISGLADVDAITISLSRLASSGEILAEIAAKGITVAVMVNTLVKLSIVYIFGSTKFFKQAVIAFGVVLGSGLLAVLLV